MRKIKVYKSALFIFSLLLGFLATTPADAVEDFSGDWQGPWESLTTNRRGNLYIHLNQSGATVDGTFKWTGTDCENIDYPLSGKVTRNLLSFTVIHDCLGDYHDLISTDSVLKSNTLSGTYNVYENGQLAAKGRYNVTRSTNFINASAGAGGTIIPSGKISVNAGSR